MAVSSLCLAKKIKSALVLVISWDKECHRNILLMFISCFFFFFSFISLYALCYKKHLLSLHLLYFLNIVYFRHLFFQLKTLSLLNLSWHGNHPTTLIACYFFFFYFFYGFIILFAIK